MDEDGGSCLPKATVNAIVRAVLPAGARLDKDVSALLPRAGALFVRAVGSAAWEDCERQGRDTVQPAHVAAALEAHGLQNHATELLAAADEAKQRVRERNQRKRTEREALAPEERARLQAELFANAAAALEERESKEARRE